MHEKAQLVRSHFMQSPFLQSFTLKCEAPFDDVLHSFSHNNTEQLTKRILRMWSINFKVH